MEFYRGFGYPSDGESPNVDPNSSQVAADLVAMHYGAHSLMSGSASKVTDLDPDANSLKNTGGDSGGHGWNHGGRTAPGFTPNVTTDAMSATSALAHDSECAQAQLQQQYSGYEIELANQMLGQSTEAENLPTLSRFSYL